jgi:DNA-binding NtrC family response regulator
VLPVGAVRPRPLDIRLVSATHQDLEAAAAIGKFRTDLFYRLNGISLMIPPLRERTDEIPDLAVAFIADQCRASGRSDPPAIGEDAMDCLQAYAWPGNIRELKNMMERALVLCEGPEILPEHLPLQKMTFVLDAPVPGVGSERPTVPTMILATLPPLDDPEKTADRNRIIEALAACASNQTRAARLLGISRRTLVSKLDYYGIPRPQKGHRPEEDPPANK